MRKVIVASVLAVLTAAVGFSSRATTAPFSCGSVCVQNLNACKSACGGDPACLAQCQSEYECCQIACHGGSCRAK